MSRGNRKRVYIDASIIVDYIKMKMEIDKDLDAYFRQELQRLRNLRSRHSFVILESTIGEAIGQCNAKGWDIRKVFDYLYDFLWETGAEIVRSGVTDAGPWNEAYKVFDRAETIIKSEWDGENPWGMDIHDIWFISQVSLDPRAKYIWSIDRRMLDYGSSYLETVCERKINVVDSLRGIR